ncbi:hypothetical protein VDG1235_2093 [Verrucomicrobiia bacterium DG1235]|nr:hypothetical protein VDG1235_2093 [Verrucomicrobiae bacterium DG1235]
MPIKLTKEETAEAIPSIQQYIEEEFDTEIGELKAKLLLDFFLTEIAPFAYNQGVNDAESYFRQKADDLKGSCHEHPLTYWTKRKR